MFEEGEKLDPERSRNEGFTSSFQYLLRPEDIFICQNTVRGKDDDRTDHADNTDLEPAGTVPKDIDTH